MKHETEILQKAKGLVPLIRAIAREVHDRQGEAERIEAELQALRSGPGDPVHQIRNLESELFLHRREIEHVEKELARLGCSLDEEHPGRIVYSLADAEVAFEPRLDETGFRPDPSGSKS